MLHKYKHFLIEQLGIPYQVQQAEDRIFNRDEEKNYEDLKNYLKANSDYKYAEDALDKQRPLKVYDRNKYKAQQKEIESYQDKVNKPYGNIADRTDKNYNTYKDEQQKDLRDNIFKDENRITPKTKEEEEAKRRIHYIGTSSPEYLRGNGYEKYRKNPITDLKQNVLDDMKAENDKELSKIPSAKINTPSEAENIKAEFDEKLRKIKAKQDYKSKLEQEEKESKRRQEEEHKRQAEFIETARNQRLNYERRQNIKMVAGAAGVAALGIAGYTAYKMAKKKKWRDKGCSTLSGSEKVKCQDYLKSKKG